MGITLDHWRKTHLALAILVTGFLVAGNAYGEDEVASQLKKTELPEELIKVRKYILENDYPEVFGEKKYRAALMDFEIADFGNDGLVEVIILYRPHYLQSPTIVIYQIQKDGSVKRIREALAPGPLVKRKNYFLDSHELGDGIDFDFFGKPVPYEKRKTVAKMAAEKGALVVQYKNFMHIDARKGKSTYIDMSHVEPFDSKRTCASFEFSKVDLIFTVVGSREDNKNSGAILAKVGNQVYMYEIAGIDKDGYLDKKISIRNWVEN
tara:strand:- start:1839 stop:2633 length:795 start_codon:yes stop_codon:yes gene_type:complete